MPFTLSHAVLAPPLSKLSQGHLPVAALAIGCMTPDLYRLFTPDNITLTHQWSGILFPNLPIGLCFCLLWYLIYRPVLYRFLGVQDSCKLHSFEQIITFILMNCFAIILGTATHLIWDGLTHLDDRSFAFKEILSQNVDLFGFHYPLHFILQIGSSLAALPFIVRMSWHYYQNHRTNRPVALSIQRFVCFVLLLSLLTGLFSVWDYSRHIHSDVWNSQRYFFIGKSINEFTQAGLSVFTLACLLFLILQRTGHFKSA